MGPGTVLLPPPPRELGSGGGPGEDCLSLQPRKMVITLGKFQHRIMLKCAFYGKCSFLFLEIISPVIGVTHRLMLNKTLLLYNHLGKLELERINWIIEDVPLPVATCPKPCRISSIYAACGAWTGAEEVEGGHPDRWREGIPTFPSTATGRSAPQSGRALVHFAAGGEPSLSAPRF